MCLPSAAPLTPEARDCLDRATALLAVQGSRALRAKAQQQAALELLQARRLGAPPSLLERTLLQFLRHSLLQLVREGASGSSAPRALAAEPPGDVAGRVALFLRAEADQCILSPDPLR